MSVAERRTATRVVAAVIQQGGKYLVCQRPHEKRHGGLWEFPGGKIEGEETLEQAVQRELSEELGVAVTRVGPAQFERRDPGSDFVILFVETTIAGTPQPLEHLALAWATVQELVKLPLAPSDREFMLTLT